MIQLDFTQEVVEVLSDGEAEGGIRIVTGCTPEGQEGLWVLQGDEREELPVEAGARVHGRGISDYTIRERYIHEQGTYEVLCQVRRGGQRRFVIDVGICEVIALRSRPESTPAYWIVGDQEARQQKANEELSLTLQIIDRKPIWDRLLGESPV